MIVRSMSILLVMAVVAGCVSSTQLVTNSNTSDIVKAKSFTSYREVLLIPPKEDPRHLIPRVVREIEAMGLRVKLMDPEKPIEPSQGTGFIINQDGWILTCAHVLGDLNEATITFGEKRLLADVVKSDKEADLALLKLREKFPDGLSALSLREQFKPAVLGEDVSIIGYPLSRMLGNSVRVTRGLISATSGLRDDARHVQISAEVHPGNSGGPLLDRDGNVIGVVNQTMNPAAVAKATGGALPQNINFAIKALPIFEFLKGANEDVYSKLILDKGSNLTEASKAVLKIQAGTVGPDIERTDKMVVHFTYVSLWDIWYRFRLFLLVAFDYETQEGLFAVGQPHDNINSNEEVVIRDTMAQFRKALAAR